MFLKSWSEIIFHAFQGFLCAVDEEMEKPVLKWWLEEGMKSLASPITASFLFLSHLLSEAWSLSGLQGLLDSLGEWQRCTPDRLPEDTHLLQIWLFGLFGIRNFKNKSSLLTTQQH